MGVLPEIFIATGPGDNVNEHTLENRGVRRLVIRGDACRTAAAGEAVSVSSRVTVKWKLQTKADEFTEDTFTMQDGTHPSGLENAILGLCAGDRVNFVLFGEASLNDFEPPPKDARGEVALSGEAEVLRVSHVRKCVYTSTPEEKAAYATEMNDIGKVLFKNARLDRAREKFEAGMSYVRVCEPEDPIINPRGAKNNDVFFPIARSVYLNLALVAFRKGEYAECELYIGDLLETRVDEPEFFKIKAKGLYRRGCARLRLEKVSKTESVDPDSAEADFLIAARLDPTIDVSEKLSEAAAVRDAKFPNVVSPEIESDDEENGGYHERHYSPYAADALVQIRRENLDGRWQFLPKKKRDKILAERAALYRDIARDAPWRECRTTLFAADDEDCIDYDEEQREIQAKEAKEKSGDSS